METVPRQGFPTAGRFAQGYAATRTIGAGVLQTVFPNSGLNMAISLAGNISDIVERMQHNKKQAGLLAKSVRELMNVIRDAHAAVSGDTSQALRSNMARLLSTLKEVEDTLREIASYKLVQRIVLHKATSESLFELEKKCRSEIELFSVYSHISVQGQQNKTEKTLDDIRAVQKRIEATILAGQEDTKAFMSYVKSINENPDQIPHLIPIRDGQVDEDSVDGIQSILSESGKDPSKVAQEVRDFAETASRIIKTHTNMDVPRGRRWILSNTDVKRGDKIGFGGFSSVYKGTWLKDNSVVAIKVFDRGESIHGQIDEIIIWKSLRHQNIHTFLGVAPFETPAFIISPYCKHGNALEYLKRYPDSDRINILLDVCRGVEYLHHENIIHGDLKARNILIADDGTALVADFGVSRICRTDVQPLPRSKVRDDPSVSVNRGPLPIAGTVRWLAPEYFEGSEVIKPSDVWSMSMCAYELFTNGAIPFGDVDDNDIGRVLAENARPIRPQYTPIPDPVWALMERCWQHDPFSRPTFSSIVVVLNLQYPELDALREVNERMMGLREGLEPVLQNWPGILEQVVQQLHAYSRISDVTPSERDCLHVILSLQVLDILGDEAFDGHWELATTETGIFSALSSILSLFLPEFPDITLMIFGILESLVDVFSDALCTDAIQGTLLSVLVGLIDSSEPDFASYVLSVVECLLAGCGEVSSEKQADIQRHLVAQGIVPKLLSILDCAPNPAVAGACNMLLLLVASSVLSEASIKEVTVVLAAVPFDLHSGEWPTVIETLDELVRRNLQHVEYFRSILFPALLPLWKTGDWGVEDEGLLLFAEYLLENLAAVEHIPELLHLLNDDRVASQIKRATANALIAIGRRATPQERQILTSVHNFTHALVPLVMSDDPRLARYARTAVSTYIHGQDIVPFARSMGWSDHATRLVAAKTCRSLVASSNSAQRCLLAYSGILQPIGTILDEETNSRTHSVALRSDPYTSEGGLSLEPGHDTLPASPTSGMHEERQAPRMRNVRRPARPEREKKIRTPSQEREKQDDDILHVILEILESMIGIRWERTMTVNDVLKITGAYIEAGIHSSLVNVLSQSSTLPVKKDRGICLRVLLSIAESCDQGKWALLQTSLLPELCRGLSSATEVFAHCELIQALIRRQDQASVVHLANAVVHSLVDLLSTGEAREKSIVKTLHCLIVALNSEAEPCRNLALLALEKYRNTHNEIALVDDEIEPYMLVDFLRHPQIDIRKLGLAMLRTKLTQGSLVSRQAAIRSSDLRVALVQCGILLREARDLIFAFEPVHVREPLRQHTFPVAHDPRDWQPSSTSNTVLRTSRY